MLDIQDKTFTYVNAGHNPPVLFRNHQRTSLGAGGHILGILPDARYDEEQIQVFPEDLMLFYTDGITETERDDRIFGEEKLLDLVQSIISRNSDEILTDILREVLEFSGSAIQNDDRTLILLKSLVVSS
jgi:sigma-B regulation protein RsbU (phosphoserine phosphatase)